MHRLRCSGIFTNCVRSNACKGPYVFLEHFPKNILWIDLLSELSIKLIYKVMLSLSTEWAEALTDANRGKHFIGDFLPPDELSRFMETFNVRKRC